MGKTNLLDAIYFLCMGKSFFAGSDRDVLQTGSDFMRLEGHFMRENREEVVVVKMAAGRKKSMERNGVAYERLADHIGLFPAVVMAPDDTRLATEGGEERRRFLDNTFSQLDPAYLADLIQYQKILRQRNAALKGTYDASLIRVYDAQLAGPARALFEKRKAWIEAFQPFFQRAQQAVSGGGEEVGLEYQSDLSERSMEDWLRLTADKDRLLERTTAGPHRDDLIFRIGGQLLRRFGSQGQVKTFVLALKMAQFELLRHASGISPILLLDDIFDKLDPYRVSRLVFFLEEQSAAQVFATDTDPDRIQAILPSRRIFIIQNGAIANEKTQ